MSIILSKKLEDEVLKDNFPSSFSIEPQSSSGSVLFLFTSLLFCSKMIIGNLYVILYYYKREGRI